MIVGVLDQEKVIVRFVLLYEEILIAKMIGVLLRQQYG